MPKKTPSKPKKFSIGKHIATHAPKHPKAMHKLK
jgi:hypothetical protein